MDPRRQVRVLRIRLRRGDEQVRNYITASTAHLQQIASGQIDPKKERDMRERYATQFDTDPGTVVAPPPGAAGAGGGRRGGGAGAAPAAGAPAVGAPAAGTQRPPG
ncbi:MAG: hypothetical protein WDN45_05730 [Caulobacteraceae bacterium]